MRQNGGLPQLEEICPSRSRRNKTEYLPVLFLIVALLFVPRGSEAGSLGDLAIVFVSIVLEAIPFMLIGSLVGGLIEAFVTQERMARLLPRRRWLTVFIAAGAGIVFPVCECAVVPVVRRLLGKGLPFSAAIAYLLGGPIVNPVVAASTALAYAFDWRIVALRLSLGYGIAVIVGMVMGRLFSESSAVKRLGDPSDDDVSTECGCNCCHATAGGWGEKIKAALTHAIDDFLTVGHYLVIGAFVAALAQTYISRSYLLGLSAVPVLSLVVMMALAVLLNLCSEADAFVAASFVGLVSIPAQLAFMLIGPMFDLKLLFMYRSFLERRAIVSLVSLTLLTVMAAALGVEILSGLI